MVAQSIKDWASGYNEEALLADGLDDAFIGMCHVWRDHQRVNVAAYDVEKCIEALMREDMSHEEAEEYFSFNIEGAYMGEATPVWLYPFRPDA